MALANLIHPMLNDVLFAPDTMIAFPILIVLLLAGYIFFLRKEQVNKRKQWFFFIQHFCFWLAISITLNYNYNFLLFSHNNIDFKNWGILIGISSLFYAMIFFIPASWITGIVNRKLWIYLSYGSVIIGIILAVILPHNLIGLIFSVLFFGIAMASNSTWYLYFSEVFLYRSHAFLTVTFIYPLVILANLIGANILFFIKSFIPTWSAVDEGIIYGLVILFIVISIIFSFFLKEQKKFIGAFSKTHLKQTIPFSWSKIMYILFLLLLVGILRELSQGDLYQFYLVQESWQNYHSKNIASIFLHLTQEFWWISQVGGGMILYPIVVKRIGIKNSLFLACAIWFLYFLLAIVVHRPIVLILLQFLNGFAFAIFFSVLFALAMVWNYRVSGRPITGMFSALNAFTGFFVQFLQRAILNNNLGFSHQPINWNLPYIENYDAGNLEHPIAIIFGICLALVAVVAGLVYFWSKEISAEYFWTENHRYDADIVADELLEEDYLKDHILDNWIRQEEKNKDDL